MRLTSLLLFTALLSAQSAVAAKKTAKAPAAPFEVEVENLCQTEASVKIGDWNVQIPAGQKSEPKKLEATAQDNAYSIFLGDTELGILGFLPAQRYNIKIANCRANRADLTTNVVTESSAENKDAEVRFRAHRTGIFLEYQLGETGRFMPLSVAMSRFKPTQAGEQSLFVRVRAGKANGPVLKTQKLTLHFEANHRYLIEVDQEGSELFLKSEDEGLIP